MPRFCYSISYYCPQNIHQYHFQNALTAATEAACLVLSIDQTIKNPRSAGGGQLPDM